MPVDLSQLEAAVREAGRQIADRAAEITLQECKDACPVSNPSPTNLTSGQLRDSLQILEESDDGTVFLRAIGSELPYAQFTDDVDTAAHEINPVYGSRLRFYSERTGKIEFRKSVWHPGTTGTRWFAEPMPGRWEQACEQANTEVDIG